MKRAGVMTMAGLVAGLWGAAATAAPIQLTFDGFAGGSQNGSIHGVRNATVAAGQFGFDVVDDGGVYWDDTLQAFCIDVTTNLVTSGTVTYDLIAATPGGRLSSLQHSLVGGLYDQRASLLGTAGNNAAFQLALWEIMYNPTSLNLGSTGGIGGFAATGFNGAVSLAQTWLNGLVKDGSYTSTQYAFYVLESPNNRHGKDINQSLLLARAVSVPEPGTMALLGLGLLGLGVVRRRRPS